MDQPCRTAGNGRLSSLRLYSQPCRLRCYVQGPGQHPSPAAVTIRGWQTWGGPKGSQCTLPTAQKRSTYRIKVQMMKGATNWSYKEKIWKLVVKSSWNFQWKLHAYVIPGSPFRPSRTGDGLSRSASNTTRYASYNHGII